VSSSDSPDRVLILGAGWLGAPLADAFSAEGAHVTTLRRSAHDAPPGGVAVTADLRALAEPSVPLPTDLGAHDVVIALVAPDRRRGDDHAGTYPAAASAAVRIARAVGARALCWISSTSVYGYTDGREVTEDTPPAATEPSQRALLDAEATVRRADTHTMRDATTGAQLMRDATTDTHTTGDVVDNALASDRPASGLVTGVLRVAGLYGPGRDPAGRYRDLAAVTARGAQWVNLAWRDDVIAAIRCWVAHARAVHGPAVPRVVNVADGTPLLVSECARLVARADGHPGSRTPPAPDGSAPRPASGRSNQRIRVDALRALGWRPRVPTLAEGLLALGYDRLRAEPPVYGPQTPEIRRFLQRVAATDARGRAEILSAWRAVRETAAVRQAERALGEAIGRTGREAERDAAAGPLLQMLRTAPDAPVSAEEGADGLDPVIVPVLGALMALVVRDVLPAEHTNTLTAPVRPLLEPTP
jgi:nucleoside-diphosphate-sugar epimerase